jgi:hypothetical protein
MFRPAVATAVVAVAATVALGCGDDGGGGDADGSSADAYVGYWAGVDPLDGGDSRRGITDNDDGTFSVVGRDTVFTLCDDTDRAIVTTDDATIEGSELRSDDFVISCFGSDSKVRLNLTYEVVDDDIIVEHLTDQEGEFVDEIIFHRLSAP